MLTCLGLFSQPQPTSTQTETLDGIGRAFYQTLERDGLGAGATVTGVVALLVFFAWWVIRERKRERAENEALETQHAIAMSAAPAWSGPRDWVRVPAHIPLTVVQHIRGAKVTREHCETDNVSAGGIAFHSRTPPPVGRSINLALDVGETRPLALRGVVVRVEAPHTDASSALVAVRLGPITPAQREHIAQWVAQEEVRESSETWKGRVCAVCKRPLESEASDAHAMCSKVRAA